jgi:alcohol dehydrogenase class IV
VGDATLGLHDLARKLAAPVSLREIGMPESGIDQAADLAVKNPYWNPRGIEREAIRELIARAWRGDAPQTILTIP